MSAPMLEDASVAGDFVASSMSDELESLRLRIVEELHRAGVALPRDRTAAVAEVVLAEAIRLSVRWVEDA